MNYRPTTFVLVALDAFGSLWEQRAEGFTRQTPLAGAIARFLAAVGSVATYRVYAVPAGADVDDVSALIGAYWEATGREAIPSPLYLPGLVHGAYGIGERSAVELAKIDARRAYDYHMGNTVDHETSQPYRGALPV